MTLLDLVQQDRPCTPRRMRPTEYHTSCYACGGEDRFILWSDTSRYYCRQCGRRGDTLEYARRTRGLSFRDAAALVGKELPASDQVRQARERAVKDRLVLAYFTWFHRTRHAYVTRVRTLSADLEVAEIGYRATVRCPDLYTDDEKDYWEQRMGSLYNALPALEQTCDLLTYDQYQQDRFTWWEEERDEGRQRALLP